MVTEDREAIWRLDIDLDFSRTNSTAFLVSHPSCCCVNILVAYAQ